MGKFSFLEATIQDIHEAMCAGTLSSAELVEWYLKRIEKYDSVIQAIININPHAQKEAKELDAYLKNTGKLKGPMHGIPVLVKDQGETAGIPSTFGSIAFKDYIPKKDSEVVRRLKESGAIILAKTNLCDFAAGWFSFSSMKGHTKNPYVLEREAGGSSAGTCAGIAANFGVVGIGEDTGGSIRIPSSFNNLFGLRVTTGLISRAGFAALLHHQDTPGPVARTVPDLAKLLDVIAGYDPEDNFTAATVQSDDLGNYEKLLEKASLQGARIGILREAFGPDDDRSRPVNQLVEAAIERIKEAGATIIDSVEIPNLKDYLDNTSLYAMQSKQDINNFLEARPDAPLKSFLEIYNEKAYHPLNDLFHDIADAPKDPTVSLVYYQKRMLQEAFRREILNVYARYNLDVMLFPDVRTLPPTREFLETEKWSSLTFETNTVIASQSILPAMSIPAGFTDDGIPVGFELLGKPYKEGTLIQYAYAYEKIAKPRKVPKIVEKE